MRPRRTSGPQGGLTLIELVLATALLSVVMVAVFTLLEGSLSLWRRSESGRSLSEQSSAVVELLAQDLRALEPGSAGDLLCEWHEFDTDGDGVGDRVLPRLRLVRQASAAEVARLRAGRPTGELRGAALLEVSWAALPGRGAKDERMEAVLWRGSRLTSDRERPSLLDPGAFDGRGRPRPGELEEVSGGLLWLGVLLATQTSIVHDGWSLGSELSDAATSWDAWNRGRPDAAHHSWNEPGAGMPRVGERPSLPRRARLELEFERPVDRLRRTRTTDHVQAAEVVIPVEDGTRLPTWPGAHVLVAGEWMAVQEVSGNRLVVRRAQRGTSPRPIPAGEMVHFGQGVVREVPVRMYREDWKL
jgi:hypothetical protein